VTRVKVCGVTRIEDARACVRVGVDTLGINFWHGTKRRCDTGVARSIVDELAGLVEIVAVFVDAPAAEIRETLASTGIRWVQLHGAESPELVSEFLPRAYKAIGVGSDDPLAESRRFPGEHILLDAAVPGAMPGGTGKRFDWELARSVARERKLTLAGGLVPGNVSDAIRVVRPYRVDVASGVESAPGIKDEALVRAFVEAARRGDERAD